MIGAITGVLSSRNAGTGSQQYYTSAIYPVAPVAESATVTTPELIYGELAQYYTSVLYPLVFEESMTTSTPIADSGNLWELSLEQMAMTTPTIQSGTLVTTVNYVTYNNGAVEQMTVTTPTIQSGTLVATINYVTYNNGAVEQMTTTTPTIQSGTLVTTINYVTYNNGAVEQMTTTTPTIQSGTLT